MVTRNRIAVLVSALVLVVGGALFVHWWRTGPVVPAAGYRPGEGNRLTVLVDVLPQDDVDLSVKEDATTVTVTVRLDHDDADSTLMAERFGKEISLDSPLGGRKVVDAATGQELPSLP